MKHNTQSMQHEKLAPCMQPASQSSCAPAVTWKPCHASGASSCGIAAASESSSRREGEAEGVACVLPPRLLPAVSGMATCLLNTRAVLPPVLLLPPAAAAMEPAGPSPAG